MAEINNVVPLVARRKLTGPLPPAPAVIVQAVAPKLPARLEAVPEENPDEGQAYQQGRDYYSGLPGTWRWLRLCHRWRRTVAAGGREMLAASRNFGGVDDPRRAGFARGYANLLREHFPPSFELARMTRVFTLDDGWSPWLPYQHGDDDVVFVADDFYLKW